MPVVKAFVSLENRSSEDKTTMRKSNVCRCLFGKPDHESLREDLNRELETESRRGKMRWNFDFKESKPIEGRYKWDVLPSEHVPEFYSRPIRPSKVRVQRSDRLSHSFGASSNTNSDDEALAVPLFEPVKRTDVLESDEHRSSNSSSSSARAPQTSSQNLVQSHIDDFMRRRKRRSPSTDENVQTKSPRTE